MTFITSTRRGYNAKDEQVAHGLFLIVAQDPCHKYSAETPAPKLRALVRFVRMTQCGHWMMASVKAGNKILLLSGDYGSDGLPKSLQVTYDTLTPNHTISQEEAECMFSQFVELPADIEAAFWEGGGHNCAGRGVDKIRAWTKQHVKELHKPIKAKA